MEYFPSESAVTVFSNPRVFRVMFAPANFVAGLSLSVIVPEMVAVTGTFSPPPNAVSKFILTILSPAASVICCE